MLDAGYIKSRYWIHLKNLILDTSHWMLEKTKKSIENQVSSNQNPLSVRFLRPRLTLVILALIFLINVQTSGIEMDLEGQLSGWSIESDIDDHWENSTGIRYIPDLDISHRFDNETAIDSEISVNMFSYAGSGPYMDKTDIDLYRADVRYTTTRTETRVGLQKINFGPAVILRPLKWFDRLDPTDPLQLTDGVYALRFRYVAQDNSNFWAWLLYGNDDPKGYEFFPSASDNIEAGGRIQSPLLDGDMGFTFHTRIVDSTNYNIPEFRENRYALDGRWDVGIGLWFEGLLQEQKTEYIPYKWTKRICLGADYTFDIGSGLYLLMEHMATTMSGKMLMWKNDYHISAFQLGYSLGIMDSISAIGYYSWKKDKFSQYISWMRTYDNFVFNISLFNFPETSLDIRGHTQNTIIGGRGIQIMVVFNH